MVKKYIDANLIVDREDVPERLWKYEEIMREKPNWDKTQGARKIYKRKEYTIYKASEGYIIHNTNKQFEKGHSHVRSFHKAKSIIDLAVRKKLPNTPKQFEVEALIRISNDNTYKNKLRDLLESIILT